MIENIKKPKRGSRPRTTLQEVQTRTEKFGWNYQYLNVDHSVAARPTVTFLCPRHGEKTQLLNNHLKGSGCNTCGVESRTAKSRLTLRDFEDRAVARGWAYSYLATDYSQQPNKVSYTCADHGLIVQTLKSHADGHGCPACAQKHKVESKRLTLEEVKDKAKVFGRNFKYLKVEYPSAKKPTVTYICPEHGEITQLLYGHLSGRGCKHCRKAPEDVEADKIAKRDARLLSMSEGYRALRVDRSKRVNHIVSICQEHGEFSQPVSRRLKEGRGCPKCSVVARGLARRIPFTELVERSKIIHGDSYDYVEALHDGVSWLHLVCKTHGDFIQRSHEHLGGHGCIKCKEDKVAERSKKSDEEWFRYCGEVHEHAYEYKEIIREKFKRSKIRVVCKTHGEFVQDAGNHSNGSGCPSCVGRISRQNREMSGFLSSLGIENVLEATLPGTRLKLDILVPPKNIAIEMNGIYWHSEDNKDKDRTYHANKQSLAKASGIRLIHIFDDEWDNKRSTVERTIRNILGLSNEEKVSARSCTIEVVPPAIARPFLERNHIQGFAGATAYFGLFSRGVLVAVAGFAMRERGRGGKKSTEQAELVRYCTSASVRGGLSKLINHAKGVLGFSVLTTFSDMRIFEGKSYKAAGFVEENKLPPDYFYSKWGKRIHKSLLQKSRVRIMADKGLALYDPDFTEAELSLINDYSKVWDCGKIRWVRKW
jgi:serine protease inhibitor ecotin